MRFALAVVLLFLPPDRLRQGYGGQEGGSHVLQGHVLQDVSHVLSAQTTVPTHTIDWHPAPLAGGTAPIVRLLGLGSAPVAPERFILELARSTFNIPETQRKSVDDLHRLRVYLETAMRLRRSRDEASPDLSTLFEAVGFRRAGEGFVPDERPLGRERRDVLERAGCDPQALAAAILGAQPVAPFDRDEAIPVPLAMRTWSQAILKRPLDETSWLPTILGDREAALLYTGLIAADRETLAFLARSPALLDAIYREHGPLFGAFGRSFVVRGDAIVTPGGAELAQAWEQVADEQTRRPDRFIRAVLGRERGRLALMYDTLAQLDESIVRCLTSADTAGSRHDALRRLYEVFLRSEDARRILGGPFSRQPEDTPFILQVLPCDSTGALQVPGTQASWRDVFGGVLARADDPVRRALAANARVSPLDLVEALSLTRPPDRRRRLEAVLFMARVFGQADANRVSDTSLVAIARGFDRYPALLLTLERIGIRAPQLYERAVEHAARVNDLTGRSAVVPIAEFQASVAMLDRFRQMQTLDAAAAERLLDRLVRLEPVQTGYRGTLAAWFRTGVVFELRKVLDRAATDAEGTHEDIVLTGLAGRPALSTRTIVWEDITYLVDPGGAEAQRMARLRRRHHEYSLDAALAFADAVERGSAAPDSDDALTAVAGIAAQIISPSASLFMDADVSREVKERLDEWKRVRGRDARKAIADRLAAIGDTLLAHALMSMVYAAYLSDPDDLSLMDHNPAARHDFGLGSPTIEDRQRQPWSLPVEQTGTGTVWHMSGSLFGFDVALAPLVLKRIIANQVPPAPRLATNDRQVFAQHASLANPLRLTDEGRDTIARGIASGRSVIAALASNSGAVESAARRVRLGPWRTRSLEWAVASGANAQRLVSLFSLSELFWLGVSSDTSRDPRQPALLSLLSSLAPWGTSAVPLSGCFCLRLPLPVRWEELSGRPSTGLLATTIPDLSFRVAELLSELRLPAALARGVLAAAAQDLLDEAQPLHSFDWHSLVAQAQSITRDRFTDYVSSLASGGPLIYVATPHAHRGPDDLARRPDP